MNSFLELYTSSDYRLTEREYHTSTWEYINVSSDAWIPFQWTGASDAGFAFTKIDIDGNETDMTAKFWGGSTLVTGWTETGGTWTVSSDSVLIEASDVDTDDFITSNEFSLTANKVFRVYVNTSKFTDSPEDWTLEIEKDGTPVATQSGFDSWDGYLYYTPTATDTDYTLVISCADDDQVVASTIVTAYQAKVFRSGTYFWYDGETLTSSPPVTDIFRFKLVADTYTYYSDWLDPCGFTGMAKITVSSSYDYGGIKYVGGYEQYMYKRASVRRDPQAEVEILGDTLNGERQNEKITSAVRYTMRMKCTESEFEALVHAVAGTIEIADGDGKTYDAQNVSLENPSMARTNGVVELTFVDGNNINVFTRNNANL